MKPHVDISTGKIYGCEKGSLKWLHEKGHIEFNNNPRTSWMLMVKSYVFDLWMLMIMTSIVIRQFYSFAVCLWAMYIFIMLYEEWWCNKYAKDNFKE